MSQDVDLQSPAPPREGYARVGGALSWSVLGKVIRGGLLFLITLYVLKKLGPVDYGYLAIARTLVGFFTVLCWMGLTQALLRYLPELRVRGNALGARRLVFAAMAVQAAIWALLLAATFLFRPQLEAYFQKPVGPLVSLATGLMLVELFVATGANILTSWYEVRDLTAAQTGGAMLYLLLGGLAVRQGYGPTGVLLAAAAANLAVVIYLALDSRRFLELASPAGRPLPMRQVLRYSLPFALTSLLNIIIWNPSEILLVGHFLSADQVSFYERGYSTSQQFLDFVPQAIWPLMFASFSEVYARDVSALPRAVTAYYKLLFFLVAPISVWGAMLSPRAVPVLLGADWAQGGILCAAFFAIFAFTYISTPLSLSLYVVGKTWINLVINIFNATIIVVLNVVLIPRYGVWGAVAPVALVIGVSPFIYYPIARRLVPGLGIPWGFILRCYLACIPLAVLALASSRVHSWYGLVGLSLAAGLLGLGCVRWFGLVGREERALVEKLRLPMKSLWLRLLVREEAA